MNKNLKKAVNKIGTSFEKTTDALYGDLGIIKDGKKQIKVQNRPRYVYVRLRSSISELIEAFNDKVEEKYGLPVILKREGRRYIVTAVNRQRYQNWNTELPHIPKHGRTHTFDKDGNVNGGDPVFVSSYQFLPYLMCPFPSQAAQNAYIYPYMDYYMGSWRYYGNTGTVAFTPYKPVSGTSLVLVSIDYNTGNPHYLSTTGTYITSAATGISQLIPYIPYPTSDAIIPIGVIRLAANTREINWTNIYDVRKHLGSFFTGTTIQSGSVAVDWDDIIDKPSVFPPDTDITDGLYVRKWLRLSEPTVNDDITLGYNKSDEWVDQSTDTVYFCADNGTGSAVWTSGGGGGGGSATSFYVGGHLAVVDNATWPIIVTQDMTVNPWTMYLEGLGTTGSTAVDVIRKRVGEDDVSIFSGVTDNRPVIQWNDADKIVTAIPLITDFTAGDILQLNINRIASGNPYNLSLSGLGGALGRVTTSMFVSGSAVAVGHVETMIFSGIAVSDLGDNKVFIAAEQQEQFLASQYVLSLASYDSAVGFAPIAGSGYGWWLQSSGAQNDEVAWNVNLPAGTYTLKIMEVKDTFRGIYHWYLDSVEVGTADAYGSLAAAILSIAGGVVSADGSVEIKLKMETKNASSSAYYGAIFGLVLVRTGD